MSEKGIEAALVASIAKRRRKRGFFGGRGMAAVVGALEKGATIAEAARASGFGVSTVYEWRNKSPAFAAAWEAVVAESARPMLVAGCNQRIFQLTRRRRVRFTAARKTAFLEHFAATCDATASAREAGISVATVYHHRQRDPAFRRAWGEARDAGYMRLEAEMVRQRLAAQASFRLRFDKEIPPSEREVQDEFERTMHLLREHGRARAGIAKPGRPPRRWSFDEAIVALDKKLKALGVRGPGVERGM